MKKIVWHEAARELPMEGQNVAVLRANAGKQKDYSAFLATFEGGQFMVQVNCDNYFSADNKIAMSYHCKITVKDIVAWTDSGTLFHTADKLLEQINNNH